MDDLYDEFAAAAGLSRRPKMDVVYAEFVSGRISRKELFEAFDASRLSLREIVIQILSLALIQRRSICWVIAYIRQLECLLKRNGDLDLREALSIQEFINITKAFHGVDGLLLDRAGALEVLSTVGTVLERFCPLTEALHSTRFYDYYDEPVIRYKPSFAIVHSVQTFFEAYGYEFGSLMFHNRLKELVSTSVVAIEFRLEPSYSVFMQNFSEKRVYHPLEEDIIADMPAMRSHAVLCVFAGVDPVHGSYYQYQDSAGPDVGDQGFLKVCASLVTHFVEMRV